MIRKCLKLNSSFIEVLKNSNTSRNPDKKWTLDSPYMHHSCYTFDTETPSFNAIRFMSSVNLSKSIEYLQSITDTKDRGDGESTISEESETAAVRGKTEVFEVKGLNDSSYLIEVQSKDLDGVKRELGRLKGDHFSFDKTIIGCFTIKCVLTAESECPDTKDKLRLAKIHAISSRCDEVYDDNGKLSFVNSIDRTARTKRMLEKFGYKISGISYRFQPKKKDWLDEGVMEVCEELMMEG